jgi:hypothetical protein
MSNTIDSSSITNEIKILLDGVPMQVPPQRSSLAGVRSYLESLAMRQQRILCTLVVDGKAENLAQSPLADRHYARISAESIDLSEIPLQLLRTARLQTESVHVRVQEAVALVMVNGGLHARELWWNLACQLKQPLLTLSLIPETGCGPSSRRVPLLQLRKWQIEQLALIIQDLDEASASDDPTPLSNALESRVLPWLAKLQSTLDLWHNTYLLGRRASGASAEAPR